MLYVSPSRLTTLFHHFHRPIPSSRFIHRLFTPRFIILTLRRLFLLVFILLIPVVLLLVRVRFLGGVLSIPGWVVLGGVGGWLMESVL